MASSSFFRPLWCPFMTSLNTGTMASNCAWLSAWPLWMICMLSLCLPASHLLERASLFKREAPSIRVLSAVPYVSVAEAHQGASGLAQRRMPFQFHHATAQRPSAVLQARIPANPLPPTPLRSWSDSDHGDGFY